LKTANLVRFVIFFGCLALIFLAQSFWFIGAWHGIDNIASPMLRSALQVFWFVLLLLLGVTFLDPFLGHFLPRTGGGKWVIAIVRIWLIASFFAFVAIEAVALVGWLSHLATARIFPRYAGFDAVRRKAFQYAAYLAGSLPFIAAVYGFARGRLRYQIRKIEVPIAGLPKELDGFKIAQLSDIHIGDFMPPNEVRRAVNIANSLKPNLAVVTGDFISDRHDPLEACIAELGRLRASLGIWGCNGNHEIYAGAEHAAQELFSRYGLKLLRQENVELEWRGARFNLIGVDYQRDHMVEGPHPPILNGIEPMIRRDIPNILLSHNPNSFHRAAELGIELSLAGHTHGGQVKLEILDRDITPARLITDFVAGLYHLPMGNSANENRNDSRDGHVCRQVAVNRAQNASRENADYGSATGTAVAEAPTGADGRKAFLYVNRGLGTFSMPIRLGVRPEITLLTLRTA
jgi:predicted MPP superfamily phosphohydrolase